MKDLKIIVFASDSHKPFLNGMKENYLIKPIIYGEEDIKDFIDGYSYMFKYKKLFGYACWKPYIILRAFLQYPDSNILYVDADTRFKDWGKAFELVNESFRQHEYCLVRTHWPHAEWTKEDCFQSMGCMGPEYRNCLQLWSGFVGFTLNDHNLRVVNEWLNYSLSEEVVSDRESLLPEIPTFKEHRHDQSFLTNLQIKYNMAAIDLKTLLPYLSSTV